MEIFIFHLLRYNETIRHTFDFMEITCYEKT